MSEGQITGDEIKDKVIRAAVLQHIGKISEDEFIRRIRKIILDHGEAGKTVIKEMLTPGPTEVLRVPGVPDILKTEVTQLIARRDSGEIRPEDYPLKVRQIFANYGITDEDYISYEVGKIESELYYIIKDADEFFKRHGY